MHIMKKQVLLIILLALPLWLKAADVSVTGLRTEQMVDPMGLDTAAPRMSWRLDVYKRQGTYPTGRCRTDDTRTNL